MRQWRRALIVGVIVAFEVGLITMFTWERIYPVEPFRFTEIALCILLSTVAVLCVKVDG